ncbi:unnamed protein product [Bursaphelenchus xylophilus]|uniref:(pine wood nematode) hypothetical protein n=1 Tax=Bursaphelenchus xylophilus TaxID=6326 RepID=A0A1I7RMI1_BURXY|nr:unnamed protein product [Bursaphelenchus xylophilus]CAG9118514.1 unnamed protein product [Bursaphelenchus xylophilus]
MIALICSCFIIYLAIFRTRNKTVKVYAHMLIMNATVDIMYSMCNLVAMPMFFIWDSYFILAAANPLLQNFQSSAYIVTSCQGFLIYVSVVLIPMQFLYRYSVISQKPFNSTQLAKVFLLANVYPFMHGVLCFFTFNPPNEHFDAVYRLDPAVRDLPRLPPYMVGDCTGASTLMKLHMANCIVMTALSYVFIVVIYRKTKVMFARMESKMSANTKKTQKQMERVIFIQALFPIIVLFIPGTILPVFALMKINYEWTGEIIAIMHTTPVFNSLSVLLLVPSYRQIVLGIFCRSSPPVGSISTLTGNSRQHNTHTTGSAGDEEEMFA